MSTVTVKDVQRLNKRIEDINTERTRVETRTQMLKDQILKDIQEYKRQFDVDLSAKSFSEIKKLVAEEAKRVSDAVTEEYNLKEQVVSCIESGDIDGANRLLGVVTEPVEEEKEEVTEETTEGVAVVEEIDLDFGSRGSMGEDDFFSDGEEGSTIENLEPESKSIPGDAFEGFGEVEDEEDSEEDSKENFGFDDGDEEDDPFGFGSMLNGGKF